MSIALTMILGCVIWFFMGVVCYLVSKFTPDRIGILIKEKFSIIYRVMLVIYCIFSIPTIGAVFIVLIVTNPDPIHTLEKIEDFTKKYILDYRRISNES